MSREQTDVQSLIVAGMTVQGDCQSWHFRGRTANLLQDKRPDEIGTQHDFLTTALTLLLPGMPTCADTQRNLAANPL